jgi:hypothetical protein
MFFKFFYVSGGIHPLRGNIFYWKKEVFNGAEIDRYRRYICDVLGAIAQTIEDCDRLLACIEMVESGAGGPIETGGNDVTLTMDRSGIQVDIDINDEWIGQPDGKFSFKEWRIVLEKWRYFLGLPESLDSIVQFELSD